jgi:hypothetical protein
MSFNNHNPGARHRVVRAMSAMMLLLAAIVAMPAFAVDSGDIVVVSLKGEVHVTIRGQARAVRAGTVLELPASVRTGRDGAIELRQGATSVRVGPETLLEFPALEKRGAPIDVIQQPRGNAFYDVGKREGRKLRVETPYLVGVIKGTQFSVAANDESTTISLFEGLLEIRATDDSAVIDLKAGEIASRRRGEKIINVVTMAAPKSPPASTRPAGNSVGGNQNLPGSEEAGPAARPVVSTLVDTVGHSTATVGTSVGLTAGNAAETAASVNPDGGASGVDAAATVTTGVGSVVDTAASAAVNLGASAASVDVSTSTQVNAGPVGVSVEHTTSVDVGAPGAAVDVATRVDVDAGPVTTAVDTGAAVDLGASGAAVDVTTSTAVDAGPVGVDVDTRTSVDVDPSGVAASVDAGAALGVPETPVDVPVTVSTGVDSSTGTVDLGLSVAGADLDLGVDLGLDGSDPATDTDSSPTDTATDTGNTGTTDLGGLLDSLLRRPGRR